MGREALFERAASYEAFYLYQTKPNNLLTKNFTIMKKNDIVALSAEQKTSVLGSIMGEITRRKIEPDAQSEERASVANTEMSSFNVDDVIQFNDELIKSVQAKMKTDKYVFAFKVRKDAENTVPVTFVLDGNGKPKLFYLSCMRKRVSEYKDPALAGQLRWLLARLTLPTMLTGTA